MKIKIERGIIAIENGKSFVKGAGFMYPLNHSSITNRSYYNDEKVLGIILENKFSLCQNVKTHDDKDFFGIILNNGFDVETIDLKLIKNFDVNKFDPYNSEYEYGEVINIKADNIIGFEDEKNERI